MAEHEKSKIGTILRSLPGLFRYFPYLDFSAQFFPIYAYLYATRSIHSPAALLLMAPFVFVHAAGFAYNNLVDRDDPPFRVNPVASGSISPKQAGWIIGVCVSLSLLAFGLMYRSPAAWGGYLAYLVLAFAYSGLGVRFKERLVGPLVMAYGWAAGPLIIALEFNRLSDPVITRLILAIFLIYAGREVYHTIIDYENDLQTGYRTFAVRTSSPLRRAALTATVAVGGLCILWSIYAYLGGKPPVGAAVWISALLVGLIAAAVGLEVYFCKRHEGYHPATAFFMLRTSFILYAILILNLPAMIAALLLWAFLMGRRS